MKVLEVITDFNQSGGAERQLLLLAKGLKQRGHEVHIVTAGGDALFEMDNAGIPYTVLPIHQNTKSWSNFWKSYNGIKKLVRDEGYEIIHSHHRWPAFVVGVYSWFRKIKTVSTMHVWFTSKGLKAKFSFKQNLIITVSESLKKQLTDNFQISPDEVKVIHNGMAINPDYKDIDINSIYRRFKIPADSFKFLNIGRLTEQKGQKYLLRAFREFRETTNTNASLIIIGSGELEESLKNKAGEQVFFLGSLPNNETMALLNDTDVSVLSSLWEGLPMTLIEAGLFSKPMISTNVDGVKEVISSSAQGVLVPPKDTKALAEAMKKLYEDSELRKKLARNMHRRVATEFSETKMVDNYEKAYTKLLQK
ncbi:glycosyltransferase family 4 protein [Patescibacteria group bacterium]